MLTKVLNFLIQIVSWFKIVQLNFGLKQNEIIFSTNSSYNLTEFLFLNRKVFKIVEGSLQYQEIKGSTCTCQLKCKSTIYIQFDIFPNF